MHLDITGPGLKWDCADGFQRQCYPLLAAWVRGYLEQIMVAQVSYGLCPMCKIPKCSPMGHSTFHPLNDSRDNQMYTALLEYNNIDALHNLGVHPICNQFGQYPLCNVYRLWRPDEFHQLLLGLLQDLLHWLLEYLKVRNVKDQFDNWFTSVQWYPSLWHLSRRFNWSKCGSWHVTEIRGMIYTLVVNCAPSRDYSKNDRKNAAENTSDEVIIGAVRALCQFPLLVSQQNHSDLSLKALDDAFKRF